ncbi:MAG: phosphatidylglycerol lysyltransferase domain-containing protein [Bacteroidales bacterium]|nr:phosphatidylglycerol lysyltransferase domain-containing protein [Bacteroidales bacterium]
MKFPFQFSKGPSTDTITLSPLKFKPISLADMPLINSMLQASQSRTCDYSIGGIYMWIDYFHYEYCVVDDTLFILGRTENRPDEIAFSLPVGELPLSDAVRMIRDYCRLKNIPVVFSAVPADRLDALLEAAGPDAVVERLDDWSDYLYDISALATLTGKHLMKKRNHVNRFFAENPHWRFEALTHELLPETMLFFSGNAIGEKTDEAMALYEHDQCRRVLDSLSSYPFEGAILRSESGEICAFTVGEVIGDTVFCHIEKINHEINGAGAAVNKLFAAYMLRRHPRLRYINREEDCGDEGLRAAKLSYHPAAILEKYNVRL